MQLSDNPSLREMLQLESNLQLQNKHPSDRILLVGQAPGPNTHRDLPLFPWPRGSAGGRLLRYSGLTPEQYFTRFQRVNVLRDFPGSAGHSKDKFPLRMAKAAAQTLIPLFADRKVILVGRAVAKVFGGPFAGAPLMEWRTAAAARSRMEYACIPHTSGCNTWWNDPANRDMALHFFSDLERQK